MKLLNCILAALLFFSLNLQAINWPWEKKQDTAPTPPNSSSSNKPETDTNNPKDEARSILEKLDKIASMIEDPKSSLQIKLTEIDSKIDHKNTEAVVGLLHEKDNLVEELNIIKSRVPLAVFKEYNIPVNLTKEEKEKLELQYKATLLVRCLVGLLAFVVLIFIMSHSHRKADLIAWTNQRKWGQKFILFAKKYGVISFCLWEIISSYPYIKGAADRIMKWFGIIM